MDYQSCEGTDEKQRFKKTHVWKLLPGPAQQLINTMVRERELINTYDQLRERDRDKRTGGGSRMKRRRR